MFTYVFVVELSNVDVSAPINNNDSNEIRDEEIVPAISCKEKNYPQEHLSQNSVLLSSESHQEQPMPIEAIETQKTSSRPQRQAAKKAESQIRVNKLVLLLVINLKSVYKMYLLITFSFKFQEIAKEITKPIDIIDEKVTDTVEALSSPLKKVCCQCNRVIIYNSLSYKFEYSSILFYVLTVSSV